MFIRRLTVSEAMGGPPFHSLMSIVITKNQDSFRNGLS